MDRAEDLKNAGGEVFAHVVYLRPSGFVIVAAEDEVEPFIAFSEGTEFHLTEEHPLGALVLRDVAGRVEMARRAQRAVLPGKARKRSPHAAAASAKWDLFSDRMPLLDAPAAMEGAVQLFGSGSISDVRVDPFIASKWNQGNEGGLCYNYYTPNNYVCGCVATAMGQWMRYYQRPTFGVGTNESYIYVDGVLTNRNLRGGNGTGGPYAWVDMPLDPSAATTETQRQAIGALCHDAGVAAHMQYSSGGSGAFSADALIALINTFGYSSGIYAYDSMADLSGTNLNTMINPNLHAKMPSMLGIIRTGGAHAVLADGYGYNSGTLYHHLNMGWGGSGDAWYNLPTIDPGNVYTSVFECVYNVYTSGVGEIVSGRITNSGGTAITGVVVTVQNETGTVLTAISDSRGIYGVINVPSSDRCWISAYRSGYSFTNKLISVGTSWNNSPICGNVWGLDFTGTAAAGPDDPRAFAAWPQSSSQIDLAWQTNASNDNVMVAWSADGAFGTPSGAYSPGDPISGGGTVLCTGTATNHSHTNLPPGTLHHYRAWSYDANTNYSSGSQLSATTHAIYYVNDASPDSDIWCSALGDDANSGTASNAPKATIQAILDTYDLEPGDAIHVDTGTYTLLSNTVFDAADQGSPNRPVTLRGSPNGSVMDRNSGTSGAYGLYLNCADNMIVRDMIFTSGYYAVYLYDADYALLSNITVRGATNTGIYLSHSDVNRLTDINISKGSYGLYFSYSDQCTLSNVTIRGATTRGVYMTSSVLNILDRFDIAACSSGIYGYYADGCVLTHSVVWSNTDDGVTFSNTASNLIENCTIAYNADDQVYLIGSRTVLLMTNCVVVASGAGDYCLNAGLGSCNSDYNDLYALNGAYVAYSNGICLSLEDWQRLSGQDANSASADPLFADPSVGDFHLKSTEGRYVAPSTWTVDTVHSPCIDVGSPFSACANEPPPNGSRVNMGAYGNTDEASKSRTDPWLLALSLNGGSTGAVTDIVHLRWDYGNIATDAAIRVEYSPGEGAEWNTVTSGVAVSLGPAACDTTLMLSSPFWRWRVTLESDTSVTDTNDTPFRVRNAPFVFYLNDSNTVGDVYCSAAANETNVGIVSNAPAASFPALLAAVDLDPGDTIYLDTGQYVLGGNPTCDVSDSGTEGLPVVIRGSPNGTVLDRNTAASSAYGLYLNNADNLDIRNLSFTNGYYGIYAYYANNCVFSNITIRNSASRGLYLSYAHGNLLTDTEIKGAVFDGVYIFNANSNLIVNSLVWMNGDDGCELSGGISNQIRNCTIAMNTDDQLYLGGTQSTRLDNSILVASGSGDYCVYWGSGTYTGDFNDLFATNGANVAYSNGVQTALDDWRAVSGQDAGTLSADPCFVNAAAGDFHLQSTAGSYHGGAWTADATNSPGIDTGSPTSSFALEPSPNGNCVNLGAYGNTPQASKSADTDSDGVSDSYEAFRLGSDPADADSDDDGMDDGNELAAGTDPTNAVSVFAITEVAQPDPALAEVRWYSVTNRTYAIDRATNLMEGGFAGVTNNIPATPPINVYTDTVTGLGQTLFYRIKTQP